MGYTSVKDTGGVTREIFTGAPFSTLASHTVYLKSEKKKRFVEVQDFQPNKTFGILELNT